MALIQVKHLGSKKIMMNYRSMNVIKYFLLIIWMIGNPGFSKSNDDKLTLPKMFIEESPIRLDGYYYTIFQSDKKSADIYFFYKNGTILYGMSKHFSKLSEYEKEFMNGNYYREEHSWKYLWGRYYIDSNNIFFEKWEPSQGSLPILIREGKILNDTTFIINKHYRIKNGKKKPIWEVNDTYYFRKLSPKPDSTNAFTE